MSNIITDHDEIRTWIEEGNGQPGRMAETELLAVYFGKPESDITPLDWDEFFEIFDRNNLAFVYEDRGAGETSSFFEFVDRATENVEDEEDAKDKSELREFTKAEGDEQSEEEDNQSNGSAKQ